MNRKKLYNDLYWGVLFLAISMSFNVFVYGVSIKIIGLFMMRRGLKNLYEESSIAEFGIAAKFCEIGMGLWVLLIAYNTAIVYLGIPSPFINVLVYSLGWAVVQYMVIINLFKGIQKYIGENLYDRYIIMIIAAIVFVAACGCAVIIPVASTIRMIAEIAMALWFINLLNKSQMQIMRR